MKVIKPAWVKYDGLSIYAIDVHPEGTKFVTGGQGENCGGRVCVWNLVPVLSEEKSKNEDIPKLLCELELHSCINAVRWSCSGGYLATAGDKLIEVWKCVLKYNGQAAKATSNAFTKASLDQYRVYASLTGHSGDVLDVSWSPMDKYMASASIDNTVIVWDALSFPQKAATLKGHEGLVKGVTWDPIGKYLASQADDKSLIIWRVGDWTIEHRVKDPFQECGGTTHALRLDWSPDALYVVSAHAMNSGGPTAQIIDRGDWRTDKDFVGHRKAIGCVRFNRNIFQLESSKQSVVALGSRDRCVSVWSAASKRPLVVLRDLFTNSVMDLSWSRSGPIVLAACSSDGTVAVVKFSEREMGKALSPHEISLLYQHEFGQTVMAQKQNLIQDVTVLLGQNKMKKQAEELSKLEVKSNGLTNGNVCNKSQSSNEAITTEPKPAVPTVEKVVVPVQASMSDSSCSVSPSKQSIAVTQQTETVRKDGKRRITPLTVVSQDATSASKGSISIERLDTNTASNTATSSRVTSTVLDEKEKTDADKVALLEARVTEGGTEPARAEAPKMDSEEKKTEKRLSLIPADAPSTSGGKEGLKASEKESVPSSATNKRKRSVEETSVVPEAKVKKGKTSATPEVTPSTSASRIPSSMIRSAKEKPQAVQTPVQPVVVNLDEPATVTPEPRPIKTKLKQMKLEVPIMQVPVRNSGGYILTVENEKTVGRHLRNSIKCQNSKDLFEGLSWTVCVDAPICAMIGDAEKVIVVCEDSTCHLLDTKGRYTFPPLAISAPPHQIVLREQYLLVITVKGKLHMWNIRTKKSVLKGESVMPLLQPSSRSSRPVEVLRCTVLVGGIPLVILTNGKSYKYCFDMQTWLLFVGLMPNIPPDLEMPEFFPHGLVLSSKAPKEPDYTAVTEAKLKLTGAMNVKKPAEVRVSMHMLGVVLAREGLEAELRRLCLDLLGPCHSTSHLPPDPKLPNQWSPETLGISKREMLKNLLNDIIKDLKWQDLYAEFYELLENIEVTSSPTSSPGRSMDTSS